MILIFLLVPYNIEAGQMEILNRNTNIFKNGVTITAESLYIEARKGLQTDTTLLLEDSIYVETEDFKFNSPRVKYRRNQETLIAWNGVRIWRKDTIRGDSLVFYRDKEYGKIFRNLTYISDSSRIDGQFANYYRDSILVKGNPVFRTKRATITSDSMKYNLKDSSYKFFDNVSFNSEEISGISGFLMHSTYLRESTFNEKPLIIKEKDSISGDVIKVNHKNEILTAYKGKAVNYLEDGKNIVQGDTLIVYYREEKIDSVKVMKNSRGKFLKNETGSRESG